MGIRERWAVAKAIVEAKRGNSGLGGLPNTVLTVVVIAAFFVAGYLAVTGLGASSSNASVAAAVGNITAMLDNIIGFAPTWGTLIGVAILLIIIVGGFMFGRNKGYF